MKFVVTFSFFVLREGCLEACLTEEELALKMLRSIYMLRTASQSGPIQTVGVTLDILQLALNPKTLGRVQEP